MLVAIPHNIIMIFIPNQIVWRKNVTLSRILRNFFAILISSKIFVKIERPMVKKVIKFVHQKVKLEKSY